MHHPGRSAQTLGNGRLRLYTLVRARMLASACRLRHTARHLGGAARRFAAAAPTATSDGDGGSGGDPSQALSVTDTNNGIEYFNPPNSTTPFSRVVRAGGMVYGTAPLAASWLLPLYPSLSLAGCCAAVSGAGTGSGPDGKARVGTAAEETKWALENVKQILEQAGSGMDLVPSPPPHRPLARCDFLRRLLCCRRCCRSSAWSRTRRTTLRSTRSTSSTGRSCRRAPPRQASRAALARWGSAALRS